MLLQKATFFGHVCASSVYHTGAGIFRGSFGLEEVSVMAHVLAGTQRPSEVTGRTELICCRGLLWSWHDPVLLLGLPQCWRLGWMMSHSPYSDLSCCCLSVYEFILSIFLWPLVKSSFLWLQIGEGRCRKQSLM